MSEDPFTEENLKAGQVLLEQALKTQSETVIKLVWCPVQKKWVEPKDRCLGNGRLLYVTLLAEDLAKLAAQTRSAPLALLIWLYSRWFNGGRRNPFPLPRGEIKGLRLVRDRKHRAVKKLIEAGLISVQPRRGKSPLVTLLCKAPKS
jgi:hypothetical protein